MTTPRLSQKQPKRPLLSGLEWFLLAVIVLLFGALIVLVVQQMKPSETTKAIPTAISVATLPIYTPDSSGIGAVSTLTGEPTVTETAVSPTPTPLLPTTTPTPVAPTPTAGCVYDMQFVADVTIPDDTMLLPNTSFVKTWRIRNSGTCTWGSGSSWIFYGGQQMSGPNAVAVPVTAPGETIDISVNLIAPIWLTRYTGYWALRLPDSQVLNKGYYVRINVVAPTATPTPIRPTATPTILNWRGEYFSNAGLVGTPALVRDDTAVNFNWGTNAPAANLPADNFSARWTRSLNFNEGSYRFHARIDDGIRLYIDNNLLLDEWQDGSARELSTDRWMAAGLHTIRIDYYEHSGNASVQVWWEQQSGYPDWRGEYWPNRNLSGLPVVTRNDKQVNFNWGFDTPAVGIPSDEFSARWTRQIDFASGTYRFKAQADDGIRIYVDGERVIDQWHDSSGGETYAVDLPLQGKHTIVVEYYDNRWQAEARFWYERIGDWPTATPVPTNTPLPTATQKPVPTVPTSTPIPTATAIPTLTNTPPPTETATSTPISTDTPTPTSTSEPTSH